MSKEILGSIYYDASEQFGVGYMPKLCKTLKATKNSLAIIEKESKPLRLGGLYDTDTKHQAGSVWDKNRIAPTVDTAQGGQREPLIIEEKNIVAMRGRNPENPSDRTVGVATEQRLEPNKQGICNTLTSVQKDNLVMEKVKIKQATSQGYIECEVGGVADLSFPDSKTRRGRVQENGQVSPTLMSCEQDIYRIEKEERFFKQALNVLENENCEVGDTIDSFNGKVNKSGVSPTITTRPEGFKTAILPVVQSYRIRKLTPLECWRLMDFSDEDFYKAEEVNSNTQLYKQAGNSIVRNVLAAIFGQMISGKENVYKEVV